MPVDVLSPSLEHPILGVGVVVDPYIPMVPLNSDLKEMVDHVIRTEINRVNARRQRRGPSTHPTVEGIDTALLDLTPHRDYPVPLGALGVDGVGWQILPRPLVADEGLPRGGALSTRG